MILVEIEGNGIAQQGMAWYGMVWHMAILIVILILYLYCTRQTEAGSNGVRIAMTRG